MTRTTARCHRSSPGRTAGGDRPYKDTTYAAVLSSLTGYPCATGYGAVTLFHDTVTGRVPDGARHIATVGDLAFCALTGRPLSVHPSNAASIGLFDLRKNAFDRAAVERAGLDVSFFPPVSGDLAPAAIGDNQASVLGALGGVESGILLNMGTGGQISCLTDRPVADPGTECRPFIGGRYLLVGSSLCGGRAWEILERFLHETAEAAAGHPVDPLYPVMQKVAAAASSLTVDTAFCGTRSDPARRGAVTGISPDNFTLADLCGAVLDGMTRELFDLYAPMKPHLSAAPTFLVGAGNGIRKNPALAARLSAAFDLPLKIPVHAEEAACGAAMYGLLAAGERIPVIEYM